MSLPVFSNPKRRRGSDGSDEFELTATGSSSQLFQDWVQASSNEQLAAYFRSVTEHLEGKMRLDDYHLKIRNGFFDWHTRQQRRQWDLVVFYGDGSGGNGEEEGPLQVHRCMSCDLDCPLVLGVLGSGSEGPTSKDTLLHTSSHMRCWLDAKARPLFVVTPVTHHERLSDMSDEEVADLFRTAVAVLGKMCCHSFNTMVLNHGNNRNHAHLHLKMRIHEPDFNRSSSRWPQQHAQQLAALRSFVQTLPPERRGTREAFQLRQVKQRQAAAEAQQQQQQPPAEAQLQQPVPPPAATEGQQEREREQAAEVEAAGQQNEQQQQQQRQRQDQEEAAEPVPHQEPYGPKQVEQQ